MDLLTSDACTLPTRERPLRLAEFDTVFAGAVTSVASDGASAVLALSGGPGLGERLLDLTARESSCCSFFEFTVSGPDEDLRLTITVPPTHGDLLHALVERAERAAP